MEEGVVAAEGGERSGYSSRLIVQLAVRQHVLCLAKDSMRLTLWNAQQVSCVRVNAQTPLARTVVGEDEVALVVLDVSVTSDLSTLR